MALGTATPPLKYCDGGVWRAFVGAKGNDGCFERFNRTVVGFMGQGSECMDTWRKAVNIVHCS